MKIHNLKQGSKEWLDLRPLFFTASEAPMMMGFSGYCTRTELLDTKKSGIVEDIDSFTERLYAKGHALEDNARSIAEDIIGEDLFPMTGSKTVNGIEMLASFDGLTMFKNVNWEHKMMNQALRESLENQIIPDTYHPQMEQQMAVSGAERTLFMASAEVAPGMKPDYLYVWYESSPDLRKKIILGWKQFKKDLASHEIRIIPDKLEGDEVETLPRLLIKITGAVEESNLEFYEKTAMNFIQAINTDLKTDKHFADAEKVIKFCDSSEKEIKHKKEEILSQTASIDELFNSLDRISAKLRVTRLNLSRSLKSKKLEIKSKIIAEAKIAVEKHFMDANKELKIVHIDMPIFNLDAAVKNKRTISSIHSAVDQVVANAKITIDETVNDYRANIRALIEHTDYSEHTFLFNDLQNFIDRPLESFSDLVNLRIIQHKQAEAERVQKIKDDAKKKAEEDAASLLEKEKEKIREDERNKLQREALDKLDAGESTLNPAMVNSNQSNARPLNTSPSIPEPHNENPGAGMRDEIEIIGAFQDIDIDISKSTHDQVIAEAVDWFCEWGIEKKKVLAIVNQIERGDAPYLSINFRR